MPRNSWSLLLPVLCLLPIACRSGDSTPAGWKSHPLGKGQVSVAAPADYRESTEPEETLVLAPANDPGVTLRFIFTIFRLMSARTLCEIRPKRRICRSPRRVGRSSSRKPTAARRKA